MYKTPISIFLCIALWLPLSGAYAGETCGCDVRQRTLAVYDQGLLDVAKATATERHAPWGLPHAVSREDNLRVLYQRHWVTGYDTVLRLPRWVSYRLSREDFRAPRKRTQCFRPDPRLSTMDGGTLCESFRRTGFDRGHMIASADMTRGEQAMVNTYVFSNIAPQYPGFNRTIWRRLETDVRARARARGEVFVITGAIFDRDRDGLPDQSDMADRVNPKTAAPRPAIATHFYKVLVHKTGARAEITAWLLPHTKTFVTSQETQAALSRARTPLSVIERMSGFNLLPLLDRSADQALAR